MRNCLQSIGWCTALWILLTSSLALAQSPSKCGSCNDPIQGKFFWFRSPAIEGQRALCPPCSRHQDQCFQCNIPVRKPGKSLSDGRLLCWDHAQHAILTQRDAEILFENMKRELFPMLEGLGKLPEGNIKIKLVDSRTMNQLHQKPVKAGGGDMDTMGLIRSRQVGPGKLAHTIYLLSGLSAPRVKAIAAHEYGHAWLHENIPADRKIDGDSVEAFCELVAYRLMSKIGQEVEKNVILQNAYTRGQIKAFQKADDQYRFFDVVQWMKNGESDRIAENRTDQVLRQRKSSPQSVSWAQPIKTKVPDELTLKGISGNSKRRFALVNNQTLTTNERAKVRVGDSSVVVKCLQINERSVILQVEGETRPLKLTLK